MVSLLYGTASLVFGVGTIPLLLSYLIGRPFGPPEFFHIEQVMVAAADPAGRSIGPFPEGYPVPSLRLLVVLLVGTCCGGLGIYLTRRTGQRRSIRTSAAGLIACVTSFVLAWLCLVRVALEL